MLVSSTNYMYQSQLVTYHYAAEREFMFDINVYFNYILICSNMIRMCICYSPERDTIAGVLLFDETLQIQSGVRHTGTTHGVKISNQER